MGVIPAASGRKHIYLKEREGPIRHTYPLAVGVNRRKPARQPTGLRCTPTSPLRPVERASAQVFPASPGSSRASGHISEGIERMTLNIWGPIRHTYPARRPLTSNAEQTLFFFATSCTYLSLGLECTPPASLTPPSGAPRRKPPPSPAAYSPEAPADIFGGEKSNFVQRRTCIFLSHRPHRFAVFHIPCQGFSLLDPLLNLNESNPLLRAAN